MNARDYYLKLYDHTHYRGKAKRVLEQPTPEQFRTVLPEHNSIAWLIWHIARGEDWTIQTVLQEREQLLTRDSWDMRMRVSERGFGGGMSRDDMIALSRRIDLDALRGYYDAVGEATRAFAREFDFDRLDDPLDVERRLALAPEAAGPDEALQRYVATWTTARAWLDIMTVLDVAFHIADAEHVLRLLTPERTYL